MSDTSIERRGSLPGDDISVREWFNQTAKAARAGNERARAVEKTVVGSVIEEHGDQIKQSIEEAKQDEDPPTASLQDVIEEG